MSEDCRRRISGRAFMVLQQVMDHLLLIARTSTPQFPAASSGSRALRSPASGSRRMRHAQCRALDCTILAASTREAVIWSRLEAPVKRKRALLCALTRSHPLLPFLSLRLSLSSLICFIPRSLRKVGGAHASGTVISYCSPADQAPVRSALRRWVVSISAVFSTPPNAFTGGIFRIHARPVTCPSMYTSGTDLPESTLPPPRHRGLPSAQP